MPGANRDAAIFKVNALVSVIGVLLLSVLAIAAACAEDNLRAFQASDLFPGIEGSIEFKPLGALAGVAEARSNGSLIGYAFSTREVIDSTRYSGKPLDIEVGLLLNGRITGARLVAHQEPILIIGISDAELKRFVSGLAGADIRQPASLRRAGGTGGIDHIAGATISSTVIRDAVFRAARRVAAATGILETGAPGPRLDMSPFEPKSWEDLINEKAIARLRVTRGEADALFKRTDAEPDALFIDLYTAIITPPMTGQNLLGRAEYENITAELAAGGHAILIAANGLYSFKGTSYRRTGHFDRIQIVQGARTIQLTTYGYRNVKAVLASGAPEFREAGVFRIPAETSFDAAKPWRLELLVEDALRPELNAPVAVSLDYGLPKKLLAKPIPAAPAADRPLWEEMWERRRPEIALTGVMLIALTAILLFQDALTSRVKLYRRTRLTFLAATLLFLGFYCGAQLSVVNVVTFTQVLLHGFKWENFLLDPLIFILWSFVALSLLFWGRGVFCGWLCPFGALQELLNEGARKLGIQQIEMPWPLHERLWPIKYIAFLIILAISLNSVTGAFRAAEIEPFKTAIVLKFQREIPFVAYAAALLAAGLFVERAYCRYLCPLGAGLAIPAKLKLFDWLHRRPQCGSECHICEVRCTVQAIDPIGRINPNECIYCLNCQANYHDKKTCIVLIRREARRHGQPPSPSPLRSRNPIGGEE